MIVTVYEYDNGDIVCLDDICSYNDVIGTIVDANGIGYAFRFNDKIEGITFIKLDDLYKREKHPLKFIKR